MFITLEDETGIANLVVWPKVFEANRRIILSASMIAARGMIQREGEVVHFVVHRPERPLGRLGQRRQPRRLPPAAWPRRRIPQRQPRPRPPPSRTPATCSSAICIDTIKVGTRDFR